MATELKPWLFLIISLLLLLIICSVAALGLFTRPTRWKRANDPALQPHKSAAARRWVCQLCLRPVSRMRVVLMGNMSLKYCGRVAHVSF
jgi:hypothetical protein